MWAIKISRSLSKTVMALFMASVWTISATGVAQAVSLIRDAEIESLLNDLTDPVISAAGLQPEAVDIYIVNDPSLNAFVAGGQNIFFHTGLIVTADTPNELLGVAAHETGHLTRVWRSLPAANTLAQWNSCPIRARKNQLQTKPPSRFWTERASHRLGLRVFSRTSGKTK
jgi:hypothetical protein